jgi:hypothetical protein
MSLAHGGIASMKMSRTAFISVRLLQELGPYLKRPHADTVAGSKYSNMKELRCQHEGRPYRVLYAFDPRRIGILLIGGDKSGNPRWYEDYIPKADAIYEQHLNELGTGDQAD